MTFPWLCPDTGRYKPCPDQRAIRSTGKGFCAPAYSAAVGAPPVNRLPPRRRLPNISAISP